MRPVSVCYCLLTCLILSGLGLLSGCTAEIPTDGTPRIYPMEMENGGDLDIQLIRDGYWYVEVTNRSSKRIDKATLWLNDGWAQDIEGLNVGEKRSLDLESFYNEFGQCYPTGNPLQPKLSKPIMKADLQMSGQMFRLNIIMEKDWRRQY